MKSRQALWRNVLSWLKRVPWRKVLAWSGLAVVVVVVVGGGIYAVFWPLSDVIARHDVGAIIGPHSVAALRDHAAALQTARDAARGRLLTFGAGLFAAGALVYTARNFRLTHRTVELTEQGQVTDRYTKAIEQLGSKELDLRIGAVYALERIACDSATDHPTVMEVLATFIRRHAGERRPSAASESEGDVLKRMIRSDVQAAITVIGRRDTQRDRRPIRLTRADLGEADLVDAKLAGADLDRAFLRKADLNRACLVGAKLNSEYVSGADLTGADLTGAKLTGAILSGADLKAADLKDTHLEDAYLDGADLTEAKLNSAYLVGAKLNDACLVGADLEEPVLCQHGPHRREPRQGGPHRRGPHWREAQRRAPD